MKKHQVKSRFYYIFWGTATVSVLAGQLYVGSGYRKMADSVNRIFDGVLVEIEKNKFFDIEEYDIEEIECPPPIYLDS